MEGNIQFILMNLSIQLHEARASESIPGVLDTCKHAAKFMEIVFNSKPLVETMIDAMEDSKEHMLDPQDRLLHVYAFVNLFWRRSVLANVLARLEDPNNRISVVFCPGTGDSPFNYGILTTRVTARRGAPAA